MPSGRRSIDSMSAANYGVAHRKNRVSSPDLTNQASSCGFLAGCSRNSFDPGITGHFGLPRLTYPPTRPVLSSHQRKPWPGHGCNWQAMGEALVPAVRILRFLRPWAYRGARFRSR